VPPDNPQALSQAAQRLHGDPKLRQRIGQGAATLALRFTWAHIAERTVDEVFHPVLAAQKAPR